MSRDFAFIVDENVEVEQITRAAIGAERNLISDVSVFDIYQGKGVDDGKKSIAINVVIQPVKQTLTDKEIEGIAQKIIDAVSAKTGATLRKIIILLPQAEHHYALLHSLYHLEFVATVPAGTFTTPRPKRILNSSESEIPESEEIASRALICDTPSRLKIEPSTKKHLIHSIHCESKLHHYQKYPFQPLV